MNIQQGLITCIKGNVTQCSLQNSLAKLIRIALYASIIGIIVYVIAYIIVKLTFKFIVTISICGAVLYNLDYIDGPDK